MRFLDKYSNVQFLLGASVIKAAYTIGFSWIINRLTFKLFLFEYNQMLNVYYTGK